MKQIILFPFLFLSLISQKGEKIEGKYKVEYDSKFYLENYLIDINDSTYVKKFKSGKKITGKIKYWNYMVTLVDDNSSQQIEIGKSEIARDTINFGTKETDSKKSLTVSYMEISINSGKLIRLK